MIVGLVLFGFVSLLSRPLFLPPWIPALPLMQRFLQDFLQDVQLRKERLPAANCTPWLHLWVRG